MSIESKCAAAQSSFTTTDMLNQIREQQRLERGPEINAFETFKTTFRKETEWAIRLFETLQKVPPNTHIHYSRSRKNFIITAPNLHELPGAQTVANLVKGHDHEAIGDVLRNAASTIETQESALRRQETNLRQPFYRSLYRLRTAFDVAVTGGLKDVIRTYQNHANMEKELTASVDRINKSLPTLEMLKQELGPKSTKPGYCVESDFSDSEWDQLCEETLNQPTLIKPQSFFNYAVSLAYNQCASVLNSEKYRWWDKIEIDKERADKGDLFLGALPVDAPMQNTLDDLKKQGIRAVLSVVEPFENQSEGWVTSAITPEQLKEAQIKQLQIPITDFDTGSLDDVQRGVAFIHWNIQNGRSIYVHCKAGRGRSALMIAAYLIKHKGLKAEQALELIKKNRPQAGFANTDPKMATLMQYENLMLEQRVDLK